MATALPPVLRWIQWLSHCFSCGHTLPHTAGKALVSLIVTQAFAKSPCSICLTKRGMSMPTGQPCTHPGLLQSKHLLASSCAVCASNPRFTSSFSSCTRTSGGSSFICCRGMSMRSRGGMDFRRATLHSAFRDLSSSSGCAWQFVSLYSPSFLLSSSAVST